MRNPELARERQARFAPRPLRSQFTTRVNGCAFRPEYPRNLLLLADALWFADKARDDTSVRPLLERGFRQTVDTVLTEGQLPVRLVREPDNPVDPLAVMVVPSTVECGCLGYLPATTNNRVAHLVAAEIDAGVVWVGWLARVRVHRDYPENPGLDVTLRRLSPRPDVARS